MRRFIKIYAKFAYILCFLVICGILVADTTEGEFKMDIETVWTRIVAHTREVFHTKRGNPYTIIFVITSSSLRIQIATSLIATLKPH